MIIVHWYLNNPRLLAMTIFLIVVSGLTAIFNLPRLEDPILTPRFAAITTLFPGASVERIESLVSLKLEQELSDLGEIKDTFSFSRPGVSLLILELREDVSKQDVPNAWAKVRERMDSAFLKMPESVFEPELKELDAKANAMLIALKWTHDSPPSYSLLRRLAKRLQERVDQLSATEKTTLFGDSKEEVIVEINPSAANRLSLNAADLSQIIAGFDAKLPAGRVQGRSSELTLEVSGSLETLTRLSKTPIRRDAKGAIVELGDIATITRGTPDPPPAKAMIGELAGVVIGVQIRDSSRIDWWREEIDGLLERFQTELPAGVELEIIFDQLPYVQTRLEELLSSFLLGGVAIFVATLIFLGWRSAIIVCVTLPLACLAVLGCLMFLGIPLHQMSMTGLVIAMGLLIDNAIVVTDEIERKIGDGKTLREAIKESCQFLVTPLIGSTLTTIFSFAPIALMPGATGEFVGTIAVSTILAVLLSFGLALTVIPALSLLILKSHVARTNHFINPLRIPEKLFRGTLSLLLRFPRIGAVITMAVPVVGFCLGLQLEEQFFPPAERDQFQIQLELAANASIAETENLARKIRQIALADPRIEEVHWFLGESAPAFYYNIVPDKSNLPNYGQALVKCRSRRDAKGAIEDLQAVVIDQFRQAHCVVRQLEQGPPFSAPIEILILGNDLDQLKKLGEDVRLVLSQTPMVTHTSAEMQEIIPKAMINIDDQAAFLAGYNPTAIAQILNNTLDGSTGGTIQEGTEEIPIRVRIAQMERQDLNEVISLRLQERIAGNESAHQGIPLSAISTVTLSQNSGGVQRYNGARCNEIHAFIPAGVLPSKVLNDFKTRLQDSGFQLPEGYEIKFEGVAGEQEAAIGNLLSYIVVLVTALVTTLVLSINSFRLAALMGLTAGLSVGFSLAALWFAGLPFGFMAIVGIVGMLGVVANDALIVLASIRADERARLGSIPRIVEILVANSRHIALTTVSTLAGFLPLYLAGGDFWPPVAIAVSFGVLGATYLALFFIPCAYLVLNRSPFPAAKPIENDEYINRFAVEYNASSQLQFNPQISTANSLL